MKTQIKTHFERRLKNYVRGQVQGDSDAAIMYLYGGKPCENTNDKLFVDKVVQRLVKGGLMKDGEPSLPGESLPASLLKLHFDMCKASEKGFRPLPIPSLGARHHSRIDRGIFASLMRDTPIEQKHVH